MELDQALRYLRNFGPYQLLEYCILIVITTLFTSLQLMGMVYNNNTPESFYCTPPSGFHINETVPVHGEDGQFELDGCRMYDIQNGQVTENLTDCDYGWEYETNNGEASIITDFNLVCDDVILGSIAQALFMAGMMVGSVTLGQLADLFGRKIIIFVSLIFEAICGMGMALAWNYYLLVFFWFFVGFFEQGLIICGFVMIMEMSVPETRTSAGSVSMLFWGLGVILVTPLAYGLPNWRHYQLVVSLSCLLALPAWWFVPESVRWLVSRGRLTEAEAILTKIAKFNKVPVLQPSFLCTQPRELHEEVVPLRKPHKPDDIYKPKPTPSPRKYTGQRYSPKGGFSKHQSSVKIVRQHSESFSKHHDVPPPERQTFLALFQSKVLMINFFIMVYCWFTCGLIYHGLIELVVHSLWLEGSLHVHVLLLCLVELPAYCSVYFLLRWVGRRVSLSSSLFISGVATILTASLPYATSDGKDLTALTITTATLGKFFVSITFGIIHIYAPEIFPTFMRNVGLGACSFFAQIGGLIAPFVLHLGSGNDYLPLNIFGVLSILAGIVSLLLPETRDKPLPTCLADCQRQGHSALCSCTSKIHKRSNSQTEDQRNSAVV